MTNLKSLTKNERKFLRTHLRTNKTPFPVFYLTMKVHKTPWTTRPIVSCSGSLLHSLGVWVDRKLQSVARSQRSYLKSSHQLKKLLIHITLPPNAVLFTADAVSMYTNIDTCQALREIATYLRRHQAEFINVPVDAVISALRLVIQYNVFRFGDTYWHQRQGTAMGTPPAVAYATLFYAIKEETFLDSYDSLFFYKRYIDDVFGIWIPNTNLAADNNSWTNLQSCMNDFHGLKWTFSPRSSTVDFLDMTISIRGTSLHTTLFEKLLNLYLYIPPHSAHPPGVLSGLVLGNCYRIYSICSDSRDIIHHLRRFYLRLKRRGYKQDKLLPLFYRVTNL